MKKYLIILFVFCAQLSKGQEVNLSDFEGLLGHWKGTLTYLNYADDKTNFTLETQLKSIVEGNEIKMSFSYIEPNGEIVEGHEKIEVSERKGKWYINKKWKVLSFDTNENGWVLLLEIRGKDNNRKSTMQRKVTFATSSLRIEKQVRYDGTDRFFQRHIYELESI